MHRNDTNVNRLDMPLGISMAVGQNPYLLKMFMSLSPQQRESLVSDARKNHGAERMYRADGSADGFYKPFV